MQISSITINEITNTVSVTTSPVVVGIEGKSALQVWQEQNPGGTYEDWISALTPQMSLHIDNDGNLILTTP